LFALSLAAPAWGQQAPQPVRIGAEDDWYPFSAARQGKPAGMVPEIVQAAYAAVGVPVQLVPLPYARCMRLAATSHLLGCFDTLRSPLVENKYRWAKQPLMRARISIYAPAGASVAKEVRVADLRGKLVAVTNGYEYGEAFDGDAAMRRDVAASDLFALQKLALGRVDYALVYDRIVDALLAEHAELRGRVKAVGTLIEPDIYLSFAPAYPQVGQYIAQFDEGLSRIKLNGEYARIVSRWGAAGAR
jgi:polar amino acid transport system substrate-binding protein